MNFQTELVALKGIGQKTNDVLQKLGLITVRDLLFYFPRTYEKYDTPMPVRELSDGILITSRMKVPYQNFQLQKAGRFTILRVFLQSEDQTIEALFFNSPFLKNVLKPGAEYIFRGKIENRRNRLVLVHPKFYKSEEYEQLTKNLQPIYKLTKGLTGKTIQKAVKQILSQDFFEAEFFPEEWIVKYELMDRKEAFLQIHYPTTEEALLSARKRFVFEEFLAFCIAVKKEKNETYQLPFENPMIGVADTNYFLERLPYQLTNAQKKVWAVLEEELQKGYAMNRLIQGDVGSGKTILAFLAMLFCAANGRQAALMAPTEVLAEQHYETICGFQKKYQLPIRPILLTGSLKANEKRLVQEQIKTGEANLVIGTHALIQDKVEYQDLALVVTDEQHRFGVRQRTTLGEKGLNPHVLVMSATPIPRTLAIILFGDFHVSILDEMPIGRLPIKNAVVGTSYRPTAYRFFQKEIDQGHQIYVICPMVEEGENDQLENVISYTEKLKEYFPEKVQIAYLHGKMKGAQKNQIMEAFSAGNIDILVSTTVIEVGINVPNATVMMVENAERFGLAQLHQLRGRVGRGKDQSYCIFINTNGNEKTNKRLELLKQSNDGFFLANEDLKLRGPGDIFGMVQSGELQFQIGDIYNDGDILQNTAVLADQVIEEEKDNLEEKNWYQSLSRNYAKLVDFRSI
ncbi:MAG: ATP-dependent DNA helicase RecG [Lachnospiraceae bacterium]|nr:ATP-dependent DNA helicase RecG [Lachnospiraceae bacterium]